MTAPPSVAVRYTSPIAMSRIAATLLAIACCGGAMFAATEAAAFCRSTTCSGDCPRDLDNCKTSGKPLIWASSCVVFSLSRQGSEHIPLATIRQTMQDSVVAWSDIGCGSGTRASLAFTAMKDADCNKAEYDPGGPNANIVIFQDHKWAYTGLDNTLAKTTVTYDSDTGEILDADLEFNHAFNEYTTGDDKVLYDLQSIATHEFGHFLGLDHTPDFLATMFSGYSEGSTDLRTIEPDDMDAVCNIYSPNSEARCAPEPKGGFSSTCSDAEVDDSCSIATPPRTQTPQSRSHAWLGLLGLAWLVGRRPK